MEFVLSMIARPLAFLLQLLYSLIGNYGISLIVLTAVIKLAMYPSYKAQMMSTMGMQDLQPKVREIQNKYANDNPVRFMSSEKMVFAIHESFLWIEDLAQPDPWILPILAGLATFASFFFQHSPSQGGPNEIMQKMMKYVFPIMIMWLAKSYPAGLALYWFVSQFLQIFFNLRFDMLKKKQLEEKEGSRKRKPVRAGKGVN